MVHAPFTLLPCSSGKVPHRSIQSTHYIQITIPPIPTNQRPNRVIDKLSPLTQDHLNELAEMMEFDRVGIHEHFARFRRTSGIRREGNGMEPLVVSDSRRMIESILKNDSFIHLDSSLFIFSVSTVARAISFASIRQTTFT